MKKCDKLLIEHSDSINNRLEMITKENRPFISQLVLESLRHFVEHVCLKIYCEDNNMDLDDSYDNIVEAISYIREHGQYRFIADFHKKHLQKSVSHSIPSVDYSETLLLLYWTPLLQIKDYLYKRFGISVINNVSKYPLDLDDTFYNYYGKKGIKSIVYNIMAPEQSQPNQPGMEYVMRPLPIFDNPNYKGSGKLKGKVAIITGGDSGLGRACSIAYVKEMAKVVIVYLNETRDAMDTKNYIESIGGECLLIKGDLSSRKFSTEIVDKTLKRFGKIDILVNNAGVQYQQDTLECISDEQFDLTMKVNVYGMFYLTREVLPHLRSGASIINLSSVTTFYGDPQLIDYVTTKGAIVGFTRSLARNLALKNIRVNAIAPGFFWTPLQPACWVKEKIPSLGSDAAMARGANPYELAPTFVFLASTDSSYVTGQVFHINGGQVMG